MSDSPWEDMFSHAIQETKNQIEELVEGIESLKRNHPYHSILSLRSSVVEILFFSDEKDYLRQKKSIMRALGKKPFVLFSQVKRQREILKGLPPQDVQINTSDIVTITWSSVP